MLARLPGWLVADGQLEVPSPGDVVHVGLRASVVQPEAERAARLSGVAGAAQDVLTDAGGGASRLVATEFPLDAQAFRVLVSLPTPAGPPPAGAHVTLTCALHVVADHEWDAFALPDVRQDWQVLAVHPHGEDHLLDLAPLPGG